MSLGWLELVLNSLLTLYINVVLVCLLAVVAVGYLSRRNYREVLQCLGVVRLTLNNMTRGIIWGLLLAGGVFVFENMILGPTGEEDQFYQFLNNIDQGLLPIVYIKLMLGGLVISLCAGVAEEVIYRGALQPRLGIIYTSILFVLIHAQYILHWEGLVIVFGFSLLFGKLRQKYDTTTTMVVHTVYDVVIFTLAIFNPFY